MQSNDNTIKRDKYENPLVSRCLRRDELHMVPEKKFTTWRALWVHLAEGEKELGLDISDDQILELKRFQGDINYSIAEQKEKKSVTTLCRMYTHMEFSVPVQRDHTPRSHKLLHADNTELVKSRKLVAY